MLRSFLIALQFLTSIPVFLKNAASDKELGSSILFYPIVGLIVGSLLFAVSMLNVFLNQQLTAALVLVTWVIMTGGLHLDGLSDTVDAWYGGMGDRERTLEIMKDPHIGAMGVVSLILILLVKYCAIVALLNYGNIFFLIVAPVLARTLSVIALLTTPYVRKAGIGEKLTGFMPKEKTWAVCITTLLILILFQTITVLSVLLLCVSLLLFWRYLVMRRLGGCTGDTTGALIEIIETTCLITLVLF